jgi:hypothetical protein
MHRLSVKSAATLATQRSSERAVAYNSKNNDLPASKLSTDVGHNTLIAANYDFKVVKVSAPTQRQGH